MSLKYGLLAFLNYGPATGYDLHKMYPKPVRPTIGFTYRALTSMAKEGLVESVRVNQEKRPDRNVFSITEAGRAVFIKWLTTPIHVKVPRNTVLVQLAFGGIAGKSVMLNNVRAHREELIKAAMPLCDRKQWGFVLKSEKKAAQAIEDPYRQVMYESAVDYINLQIKWLDSIEERLSQIKE